MARNRDHQTDIVDNRACAERLTPGDGVDRILTRGYRHPGDGGGATYRLLDATAPRRDMLQTADGRSWALDGREANVRQFGAVGDGIADDTAAIQAALLDDRIGLIRFPAGTYRAVGLVLRRPCTLVGEGAELVWTEAAPEDSRLLWVRADGVSISGLRFRGICYESWETPVSPHGLLWVDALGAETGAPVRLTDLAFEGGEHGLTVAIATDVFIDRINLRRCKIYGLVLMKGPRNVIVKGLIAREIGRYGGVKLSYSDSQRPTERMVITDFVIEDSCRLHPDPSEWQEGLDLICGAVRDLIISNGVIAGCANGGIELKTGGRMIDPVDEYNDVQISNVNIRMSDPRHGIVFNWTGSKTNSAKRGRRVVVSDCIIRHDVRGPESVGIEISAWSDLVIQNSLISGGTLGFRISPYGGTSDLAERVHLLGNRIEDVESGFIAMRGELMGLEVANNTMRVERFGIQLSGAAASDIAITGNRIVQTGGGKAGAAILLANCRTTTVWNNYLQAEHGDGVRVRAIPGKKAEGEIVRNLIRASRSGIRVEDGRFAVIDNHVTPGDGQYAVLGEGSSDLRAAWNVRGVVATPGRAVGGPGDVLLARGDRSGELAGWRHDPDTIGGWQPIATEATLPREQTLVERVAPAYAARLDAAVKAARRWWSAKRRKR